MPLNWCFLPRYYSNQLALPDIISVILFQQAKINVHCIVLLHVFFYIYVSDLLKSFQKETKQSWYRSQPFSPIFQSLSWSAANSSYIFRSEWYCSSHLALIKKTRERFSPKCMTIAFMRTDYCKIRLRRIFMKNISVLLPLSIFTTFWIILYWKEGKVADFQWH